MAPTKRPYTFTPAQQDMLKQLAERKHVKVQRKKKVPVEEPVPEPVPEPEPEKEQKRKRIKHKYVKVSSIFVVFVMLSYQQRL